MPISDCHPDSRHTKSNIRVSVFLQNPVRASLQSCAATGRLRDCTLCTPHTQRSDGRDESSVSQKKTDNTTKKKKIRQTARARDGELLQSLSRAPWPIQAIVKARLCPEDLRGPLSVPLPPGARWGPRGGVPLQAVRVQLRPARTTPLKTPAVLLLKVKRASERSAPLQIKHS